MCKGVNISPISDITFSPIPCATPLWKNIFLAPYTKHIKGYPWRSWRRIYGDIVYKYGGIYADVDTICEQNPASIPTSSSPSWLVLHYSPMQLINIWFQKDYPYTKIKIAIIIMVSLPYIIRKYFINMLSDTYAQVQIWTVGRSGFWSNLRIHIYLLPIP